MQRLSALFIGGNGTISGACSRLAIDTGWDLTLVNRGRSTTRPTIEGASSLVADANDPDALRAALGDRHFDVVVNFHGFTADQVQAHADLFDGRCGQYVFISSASAYAKPVPSLPIRESTALHNPFWQYSRDKIACEDVLVAAHRRTGFPVTIVRPSHTYDPSRVPLNGGWVNIDRMRRGKPTVVYGDGTSLWTLTHHTDFARAFVGLLGNPAAIGEAYHITSDETLTWNAIATQLADAAGVTTELVPIPSAKIAEELPDWGPGLLGDKGHSVIFDNTKVKTLVPTFTAQVPFWRGAREIVAWHDAEAARRTIDPEVDAALDRLIERWG